MAGTSTPDSFNHSIIEYSFSGTLPKSWNGSLTIQSPPSPLAGRVSPRRVLSSDSFS